MPDYIIFTAGEKEGFRQPLSAREAAELISIAAKEQQELDRLNQAEQARKNDIDALDGATPDMIGKIIQRLLRGS